jgi:hypothetical protein
LFRTAQSPSKASNQNAERYSSGGTYWMVIPSTLTVGFFGIVLSVEDHQRQPN